MKNGVKQLSISELSTHLFWDVDATTLDPIRSSSFIIRRVLQYGTINDWNRVAQCYGIQTIARVAMQARDLDRRAATFVSLLSGFPKEKFKCYADRQSTMQHWIC